MGRHAYLKPEFLSCQPPSNNLGIKRKLVSNVGCKRKWSLSCYFKDMYIEFMLLFSRASPTSGAIKLVYLCKHVSAITHGLSLHSIRRIQSNCYLTRKFWEVGTCQPSPAIFVPVFIAILLCWREARYQYNWCVYDTVTKQMRLTGYHNRYIKNNIFVRLGTQHCCSYVLVSGLRTMRTEKVTII